MITYLVVASETDSVVAQSRNLAAAVIEAIDLGYTTGRIYNQDGGSASLAEWIRDNPERIEAARRDAETEEDEHMAEPCQAYLVADDDDSDTGWTCGLREDQHNADEHDYQIAHLFVRNPTTTEVTP